MKAETRIAGVTNPAAALLEFDGVEKRFSGIAVLKQVTFDLGSGQTLGLVGENGAGKSDPHEYPGREPATRRRQDPSVG